MPGMEIIHSKLTKDTKFKVYNLIEEHHDAFTLWVEIWTCLSFMLKDGKSSYTSITEKCDVIIKLKLP